MKVALLLVLGLWGTACSKEGMKTQPLGRGDVPRTSSAVERGGDPPSEALAWVGTWGASPQLTEERNEPPAPGLTHNTLRQFAHVSLGGRLVRIQISNEFGDGPVRLKSVHLAEAGQLASRIDLETDVALTFQGASSITIPPGEAVYSDPTTFLLRPQSTVALSVHFGETPAGITGHPGSRTTSYLKRGAAVSEPALDAVATEHWYYWTRLEVVAAGAAAVVTLGDSITDGRGSTTNQNDRWPDVLSRRLRAHPATENIAVINAGIGGNAVIEGGLGPPARERFERDVLSQAGVRWVILLAGINDIGLSDDESPVQGLIHSYEEMIDAAHEAGVLVYGVPLLPFAGSEYDAEHGELRQRMRADVNRWIRGSGRFDAVIAMDEAVADPADPTRLDSRLDDDDFLHPNPEGYQKMADAIPLDLFR